MQTNTTIIQAFWFCAMITNIIYHATVVCGKTKSQAELNRKTYDLE